MKNVTQKGVYYNLYDSPFYYEIENFKLYFSSEYRKKLFLDKKYLYVKEKEIKLKKMIPHIDIDLKILLLIELYFKIEYRGQFITYKNKPIKDLDFLVKYNDYC